MYSQLVRYLERRPEKYFICGNKNVQTLLLLDEFARFGKLDMITSAMATLRSKSTTICLVLQSMAQLDMVYGKDERRTIFDNSDYVVILRANDPDTQQCLTERIGTYVGVQRSAGEHLNGSMRTTGYNRNIAETREWRICPHELSMLKDVLLLSPYGFCRLEKFRAYKDDWVSPMVFHALHFIGDEACCYTETDLYSNPEILKKEATMLTIDKRAANAANRTAKAQHQQRVEQKAECDAKKKKDSQRNYIIGALVSQYFPGLLNIEPGSRAENETRFKPLTDFLSVLTTTPGLVKNIQEIIRCRGAMEDLSGPTDPDCVCGQAEEEV